jgi:hypothetical protein
MNKSRRLTGPEPVLRSRIIFMRLQVNILLQLRLYTVIPNFLKARFVVKVFTNAWFFGKLTEFNL